MKVRTKIIIAMVVIIIAALAYGLSPLIDSYRANGHIKISGIKLLMTPSEVEKLVGKGNPIGGFGADFMKYPNERITIAYSFDGLLKGRAGYIEISNPDYSIFDVHPGDAPEKSKSILEKHGFEEDETNKGFFKRGSVGIYIMSDGIRINIEDWTLRGRVY